MALNDAVSWPLLVAALPHAAWVADLASQRVVAANAAAAALLGRPQAELLGAAALDLAAAPEDLAWWQAAALGETANLETDTWVRQASPGGDTAAPGDRARPVLRSITVVGAGRYALVQLFDRSADHRLQAERESLLADLQATLEATADGIFVTDLDGHVRAFNQRFAELWRMPQALLQSLDDSAMRGWMASCVVPGVQPAETAALAPGAGRERASADAGVAYDERVSRLLRTPRGSTSERLELRDGTVLECVTRPLFNAGRPQGRVWSYRDLTARVIAEERVEAAALHDVLTGLPNRAGLAPRVDEAAARARREGAGFALLFIDLDRFRTINDSLGHDCGDRVLLSVAQRIQACLRADDVLARLGGDQFAVLVQPADGAAAEATARRVLNVVGQPCNVDGAQFTLTCSIGVALAPSHGNRIDDLTRHAETAMRAVKRGGRASYRLHQARAEGDRRMNLRLDHAMRQALVSGRFRLHYQPQVDLNTGAIVGAEALLRWRDPELGEIPPGRFIPVAEESGFIVALGDWVLSQAVRQAALWHSRGLALPVAVNVSALQFQQAAFVERVAGVLAISGIPPRLLELELTESILVHDADEALHRLHALARLGVQMSIDDFGTGYSSLSYLKRFPIGKLKIDRSFVMGLPGDESDAGIVRAILQMARALGKTVIAEGVETEEQRQFLQDAGCDEYQGFLFAPALDTLSFEHKLQQLRPAAPARAPFIRLVGS